MENMVYTNGKAAPKQQQTLKAAFKRRQKFPGDCIKVKNITERVMDFMVLDDQPISVVEHRYRFLPSVGVKV